MKLSERNNQGARDYHRQRALNSAKMRLLSLAYDAIQDNTELTRREFMERQEVKKIGLCDKSIFNYLVNVPFKKTPRQLKVKKENDTVDIWYRGHFASIQGKQFHQLLGAHK